MEPVDKLQAQLDAMLLDVQAEAQLTMLEAIQGNTELIARLTQMILDLTSEVSLMQARVLMLEADRASG